VLGAAVLLSAVFWLPPFARRGGGAEGPDPGGDDFGGERLPPSSRIAREISVSFLPLYVCMYVRGKWSAGSALFARSVR
jgi:hypothetical protein